MQDKMKTEAIVSDASAASVENRFASVYRVLSEAIAARAFPGCAFGVYADGKVVLQDALGRSTYDSDAFEVTAETVYDIASITKVVATTATAMLLTQRGLLDLDTPLGELLPGFVVGRATKERAREVTIRHILAHNSGLPGYAEIFRTATTPKYLLRACLQMPLGAVPGTRAEYSDLGFILLGKALEVLTRESLATWAQSEVFDPLQLAATGFNPARDVSSLIPPTENDTTFRQRRIQGEVQDENAWVLKGVGGHAGVFSNVPDLLRFAAAVLQAGRSGGDGVAPIEPLFSKPIVEQFAMRQGPEGSSRALGWDTPSETSSAGHFFSEFSIGHLGYSGCSLWIDLDAEIAVVLLTNRTWPDRTSQLIREVRPAFHDAIRGALASIEK
jgi:CubicO group peptidase (beta-lactamase class C family)